MDFGSRSARFLAMLGCLVALLQCRKVPLSQDYGYLEIAAAHWFENEKVTYVFFSMRERPDLKARGTWQLAYTKESAAGGTERVDFQDIDFSSGVHGHRLVDCARNRICGSFSFRSDEPLLEADIRYYYDSGSALGLEATAAVQNHLATDFASSYSALPYGVFDKKNEHLQVRIHNNFGSPSDDEVSLFGLERSFIISDPRLATITMEDYMAARETTGGAFVFPS